MPYAKLIMEDGEAVLIEVDIPTAKEKAAEAEIPFDKVMKLVEKTVKDVHRGYVDIPKAIKPKSFSVSFGITISAQAGVPAFSKVGVDGSFTVTMNWGEG
jgi:hypothetical protein